ncbi:MAG TPA: MBL fold metallo-hydrolase [Pirellulales bacterium]|jgi:ribonuclease BN (tRNA processing enzyme)|nr:MBL fold metallo-hydrolase [Pirellulales bacterium]
MKLVLLGTTGYHPNDLRQTACLMLPEIGVLLDAGTALYRARDYLQTKTLDLFLSHAHLDHVIGLTYLFDVVHERSVERVTIHGERAKLAALDAHLFATELFPIKLPYAFQPLHAPVALADGGRLSYFPLVHPGGSLGFRLDWPGHSLAYVTDTTAAADAPYLDSIRNVDLLVHECYFDDAHAERAQLTGHSCLTPVAQLARAAGVGRLVLVHVNPLDARATPLDLSAARAIFPATEIGADRQEIEF